jgi:general secretion pathway protein G
MKKIPIQLNQRKNERGFTLVEIMVVVIIIGLIAGLVGPRIFGRLEQAKVKTSTTQMQQLKAALATYRLDVGRYPDSIDCLIQTCDEGWAGPYLDSDQVPLDPWKNQYVYEVLDSGKAFTLTCSSGGGEPIVVKG